MVAWNRDARVEEGKTGERNDGGIFDFFCCHAGDEAGWRASARADFRSMEQLTAETQGSSGSETWRYLTAYVPHARDRKARVSYRHLS